MEKEKVKNKYLITLSQAGIGMMQDLMKKSPYDTPSKVLSRGLEEFHKKFFNYNYVKSVTSDATPEEAAAKRAELKELDKKAIQDRLDAPKIAICEQLGGEVITNSNGSKVCKWETHSFSGDGKQTLPIHQMDPVLVENQYNPSKAAVLKARPDLAKKINKE